VNPLHFGNQPLRVDGGAKGGGGNKLAGAPQAAEDIVTEFE
jgi:hypothetical protein